MEGKGYLSIKFLPRVNGFPLQPGVMVHTLREKDRKTASLRVSQGYLRIPTSHRPFVTELLLSVCSHGWLQQVTVTSCSLAGATGVPVDQDRVLSTRSVTSAFPGRQEVHQKQNHSSHSLISRLSSLVP